MTNPAPEKAIRCCMCDALMHVVIFMWGMLAGVCIHG